MSGQRARATVFGCAGALLLLACAGGAADMWAQFRGGPAKTGLSLDASVDRDAGWSFVSATETQMVASPVTDGSGVIVAEYGGTVSAVYLTDGSLRWTYRAGDLITATPAVVNTTVLVPTGKRLIALNVEAGGTRVSLGWTFNSTARIDSSPTVAAGAVYVGSDDRQLYKLDLATGAVVWNYTAGDAVKSSPAVVGSAVYFGSYDGFLYALTDHGPNASLLWRYNAQGEIAASPAVAMGNVYATTLNGRLVAVTAAAGARAWEASPGGVIVSSPAVADGQVFIGGDTLAAFDAAAGGALWERTLGGYVRSSPAVHDGLVFAGDYAGRLFAFRENGSLAWSFDTGAAIRTSPAVAGGLVLVANDAGRMMGVPLSAGEAPQVQALHARSTYAGVSETFTAAAADPEGKDLFFSWAFSDGAGLTGKSVKHAFNNPGNYSVVLTVSDGVLTTTVDATVTVAPLASTVSGGSTGPAPTAGSPTALLAAVGAAVVLALLAVVLLLRRRSGPLEPADDVGAAGGRPEPPAGPAPSPKPAEPPGKGPRGPAPPAPPPPSSAAAEAQRRQQVEYYASLYGGPAAPPGAGQPRAPRLPKP